MPPQDSTLAHLYLRRHCHLSLQQQSDSPEATPQDQQKDGTEDYDVGSQKVSGEFGKEVKMVGEAYTSETCSRYGWIHQKFGGRKMFSCRECGLCIDRDVNGARGMALSFHKVQLG